jgi:hypothetical protein
VPHQFWQVGVQRRLAPDELDVGHPELGGLIRDPSPVGCGHDPVVTGRSGRRVAVAAAELAAARYLEPKEAELIAGSNSHRLYLPRARWRTA